MINVVYALRVLIYSICLIVALGSTVSSAEPQQQFLVLPEINYLHEQPDALGEHSGDFNASLDLLYALDVNQFRFFTEIIATDTDADNGSSNIELARYHAGYETSSGTTLLFGLFQLNQGYWNKAFHFRNYIQPSILPPGIASFEREGGALPVHVTGVNVSRRWALRKNSALYVEASFGAGTKFGGNQLKNYDIFNPGTGSEPSSSLRLSYLPNQDLDTEIGIFFVDNRIPTLNTPFTENKQKVYGSYFNSNFDALRLYAAVYWINNELNAATENQNDNFYSAWLQSDYRINKNWLPYLRFEHSNGNASSPYLAWFPKFVRDRRLIGLRWDLIENHALKFEYANTTFLQEDSNQWAIQWSMIFP